MTGPESATAMIHLAALVGIFVAVLIVALFVCEWIERRDDEREAARRDLNAATIAHWRDTNPELADVAEQAWEDHPAFRADVARRRRDQARRRMNREAWERGASA